MYSSTKQLTGKKKAHLSLSCCSSYGVDNKCMICVSLYKVSKKQTNNKQLMNGDDSEVDVSWYQHITCARSVGKEV